MQIRSLLIASSILALAACSTTKPDANKSLAVETPVTPNADLSAKAQTAVAKVEVSPFDDPASPLSRKSVFFEFDKYSISAADQVIVTAHANYIANHGSAKVRLEGNADERGGREYNLALGQKRADAVKKSLELLGVPDSRVEAVSFGKEKPVDFSHNEDAWAKNRRVDIKYISR
jgi:peptidoglycan-associated lipoprotein